MLHKHEPVSEKQMESVSPRYSICETIRQAYHLIDNDDARLKLREATAMAKAMSAKLSESKNNWFFNEWGPNPDFWSKIDPRLRRPIDVLFIAHDDFANTGYRFWMCAKRLGLNAVMVKGLKHPFNYPNQAPLHPSLMHNAISQSPRTVLAPDLEYMIESSNLIHLIASTYPLCSANWRKHPVIVQHGGTSYRQDPISCNDVFNQIAHQSIIQCPDLLGLGAKNEELIYYPVDTISIRPDFSKKSDRLVVGHFPSNPVVKGTESICNVINDVIGSGVKIEYIGETSEKKCMLTSWENNLKRFKKCDVIIETLSVDQNGKPYGEWGNTALEAAASGCIVVTNCIHKDIYEREYGSLGLNIANSKDELRSELVRLAQLSEDDILKEKKNTYKWASEKHSIDATAERLWNKVYSRYF